MGEKWRLSGQSRNQFPGWGLITELCFYRSGFKNKKTVDWTISGLLFFHHRPGTSYWACDKNFLISLSDRIRYLWVWAWDSGSIYYLYVRRLALGNRRGKLNLRSLIQVLALCCWTCRGSLTFIGQLMLCHIVALDEFLARVKSCHIASSSYQCFSPSWGTGDTEFCSYEDWDRS